LEPPVKPGRFRARVNATELWSALTAVVSRYSPVPIAQMHPEALLLGSQSRAA
jgi:hypothetical protein